MKTMKKKMRKGFTLVELLVVIAIIAVLAGLATPAILRAQKNASKAQALRNAKEIGIALLDFKEQYSDYPSDSTRERLIEGGDEMMQGESANAYLGQLLAGGSVDTEKIFFAKGVKGAAEGDDVFSSAEKRLGKGENIWAYVTVNEGETVNGEGSIVPIICTPVLTGGEDPTFDDNPFGDQYCYLRNDNSAQAGKITKDGRPQVKGRGKDGLFSTKKDGIFEGMTVDVKIPLYN